jgi:hypothetical protein
MKVKELIKLLQEEDPTGELEVAIDNQDIHYIDVVEAYWDGRLERVIKDSAIKGYNVIGGKVLSSGKKLRIHTIGIEDVICNDPDVDIDLSDLEHNMPTSYKDWSEKIVKFRQEIKDIIKQVNEGK